MDRILLIEDDAGAQLVFKNRLKDLGYEVVVASTGARGLMEARADHFDLFLVDIGLGSGIDGYEVCRRLKTVPQIHGIPVVLISGQVKSQEELHRGYEAGCEAFLLKGDLTLVEDVVRAMLRIKSLQDDLGLQNRLLEEQNRRLQEERRRGADLETALRETGSRALVFHELAAGHPDGVLLVDPEGVVRVTDRGAHDILGKDIEGKHLASLTPGTGLEAFVRNARTEPHEAYRFDLGVRSLSASVVPTVPRVQGDEHPYKVVLILDAGKRRVAAEMLRLEEQGIPRRELGPLLEAARTTFHPSALVGKHPSVEELRGRVAWAAGMDHPVLISGESGTGKQFVARILHFAGPASGPFVPVNCAALAPSLLEGELFGHVKGAFPEAVADRPGLLQQARHGTIFLDEIGEVPPALQSKLLEVLEENRVYRMGSQQAEEVSARIVAATSANLEQQAAEGAFRKDLLYRLNAIDIQLPPLRERGGDVELLAEHFLERYGASRNVQLSSEASWVLTQHDWPGNVRELENCIESACALAKGAEIHVSDLSQPLHELYKRVVEGDAIPAALPLTGGREAGPPDKLNAELGDEPLSLQLYEKLAIRRALRETGGDKLAAARLLNIGKSTFYRKLKAHRIT